MVIEFSFLFSVDLEFERVLTEVTNRSQLLLVDMVMALEHIPEIVR